MNSDLDLIHDYGHRVCILHYPDRLRDCTKEATDVGLITSVRLKAGEVSELTFDLTVCVCTAAAGTEWVVVTTVVEQINPRIINCTLTTIRAVVYPRYSI